jgi:hypothetical protein
VASASSSKSPRNGLWTRFNRPLGRVVTIALVLILFFALFASYQMRLDNGGTTEPSGNGDAAEPSLRKQEQEQEQAALLRGVDIDYDSFYAEARATGLKIGQRYRFTAAYESGDVLYQNRKSLRAIPAFDDQAQYTEFLKGDNLGITNHRCINGGGRKNLRQCILIA